MILIAQVGWLGLFCAPQSTAPLVEIVRMCVDWFNSLNRQSTFLLRFYIGSTLQCGANTMAARILCIVSPSYCRSLSAVSMYPENKYGLTGWAHRTSRPRQLGIQRFKFGISALKSVCERGLIWPRISTYYSESENQFNNEGKRAKG